MNNFDFTTRFLLTCAGVDLAAMAKSTPTEVTKYKIMGTCVLIPTLLGLFSGGYAMYLISGSWPLTLVFAPVWGFIIFTLDRAVVSTTKPGRISFGVLARVFLAIVIAFTISEPLVIRIFKDAIEDRRVSLMAEKRAKATSDLDKRLAVIDRASTAEKNHVDQLDKEYIGEVDGTTGSKIPARGPIAAVKEQAYLHALADYNRNEIKRATALKQLQTEKDSTLRQVTEKDARGFLGDLRVLGKLCDEDSHVGWAVWLVRALFLCIELVPVLIKAGAPLNENFFGELVYMMNRGHIQAQNELMEANNALIKYTQLVAIKQEEDKQQFEYIKTSMTAATRNYEYFLAKIDDAARQKAKAQLNIIEKVKDELLRPVLMEQVEKAYNGYVETLMKLMHQAQEYQTSAKL